jgi:hypothetical protein
MVREDNMGIVEYSQLIRDVFSFLFEDFGFSIVYSKEQKSRFKILRAGLQSDMCKILFVREQGAGVIFLGTPTAPFENEMNEQWVSSIGLLSYLLKKDIDWNFLNTIPHHKRVKASLEFSAQMIQTHFESLIGMVSSIEKMEKWKPDYQQYVREKRQNK